ncbi:hypothetical protein SAMN02744133_108182 [Thalassospira xiamenensis M-5 = DSM 17429]|uniref:Uncharacterized protein n=1 Tax=Thalassospira xiamenensis M-5 = DSM 17429 TaxID=1123366 RepID=A0AB72UJV0_9PROT|nr:hypothetical protein [Thalassospira xiamenensis]AJD54453.1 hypothetical protein TH3_21903 [Thalassospira xiamenensis M-5 = DSM 17429]SIT22308.1 hypothetical protein SAMN02744133_108182 [Thalassospira xiamenensis M-5 = DSM 17429]
MKIETGRKSFIFKGEDEGSVQVLCDFSAQKPTSAFLEVRGDGQSSKWVSLSHDDIHRIQKSLSQTLPSDNETDGRFGVTVPGDEGGYLRIALSNRGEPYREGICLDLIFGNKDDPYDGVNVFLAKRDSLDLRNVFNRLTSD